VGFTVVSRCAGTPPAGICRLCEGLSVGRVTGVSTEYRFKDTRQNAAESILCEEIPLGEVPARREAPAVRQIERPVTSESAGSRVTCCIK